MRAIQVRANDLVTNSVRPFTLFPAPNRFLGKREFFNSATVPYIQPTSLIWRAGGSNPEIALTPPDRRAIHRNTCRSVIIRDHEHRIRCSRVVEIHFDFHRLCLWTSRVQLYRQKFLHPAVDMDSHLVSRPRVKGFTRCLAGSR